jgi:hypothetical protein
MHVKKCLEAVAISGYLERRSRNNFVHRLNFPFIL